MATSANVLERLGSWTGGAKMRSGPGRAGGRAGQGRAGWRSVQSRFGSADSRRRPSWEKEKGRARPGEEECFSVCRIGGASEQL